MNNYREQQDAPQQENSSVKKKPKATAGKFLQRLLSGDFLAKDGLVQHTPFIAFLVVLFLLNIGLVYHFENTARERVKLQNELNEMHLTFLMVILIIIFVKLFSLSLSLKYQLF